MIEKTFELCMHLNLVSSGLQMDSHKAAYYVSCCKLHRLILQNASVESVL
jgi:hypothetical protein